MECIIDHHLLGLHHVNETAPPEQWLWWDLGFLASGALTLVGGWAMQRRRERRVHATQPMPRPPARRSAARLRGS